MHYFSVGDGHDLSQLKVQSVITTADLSLFHQIASFSSRTTSMNLLESRFNEKNCEELNTFLAVLLLKLRSI